MKQSPLTQDIRKHINSPIIIDSIGQHNEVQTHISIINDMCDDDDKLSTRIVYAMDFDSKIPLVFLNIPNLITYNLIILKMAGMLSKYDLQVEAAISDVDRFYDNDLNELMSANIPFVIMMSEHRKEFNTIMKKYTKSLLKETREDLALAPWHAYYAKKIDFNFLGEKIFAYPMIDVFKKNKEVHDLFY